MKVFEEIGRYLSKTNLFISKQKPIILTLAFFAGTFIFFSFVYVNSTGEPRIDDHYFHLKYAYLLRTEGLDAMNNFKWIHFSGLAQNDIRYSVTLFQIILIPFTFISDMVTALKFADVFVVSVSMSIIYYSLKKMKVKYAFLISLLLLSFEYITLRLFLGRSFVIVISLAFLEIYFATAKKYKSLALVSAIHVLLHQTTFVFPLIMVGSVEFARYLVDSKIYIKNLLYAGGAITIAMMFFPGFPHSMLGTILNAINIQSQDATAATGDFIGGSELKKIDVMEKFINMKVLALILIFNIMAVVEIVTKQIKTKREFSKFNKEKLIYIISLFILSVGFLYGSITMSGRFLDFLIPMTVVLFVLIITIFVESKKIVMSDYVARAVGYTALLFFVVILVNTVFVVRKNINYTGSTHIQKAAEWINERSDDDEVVFLYNWSDFSWMFFYNSDNVYTMGIEPMALRSYDEGLYWKYYNMFKYYYKCDKQGDCKGEIKNIQNKMKTLPKYKQQIVQRSNSNGVINSIKNDFESRFIVSKSKKFNDTILLNKNLIEDWVSFRADNGKEVVTVFMLK